MLSLGHASEREYTFFATAFAAMSRPSLIRTDAADFYRARSVLVGAIELAWRFGAFFCLLVTAQNVEALSELDARLSVLALLAAFCFVPRLDVAVITLGLVAMLYLVGRESTAGDAALPPLQSINFMLVWMAVGLVACAGVLHAMSSSPRQGMIDRDIGALLLGWVAAALVMLMGSTAAGDPLDIYGAPSMGGLDTPLTGEPARFIVAAMASTGLVMGLALPWVARRRRRSVLDPQALQAHALTGAMLSVVAWMAAGEAMAAGAGYPSFGAAGGGFVGLVLWSVGYVLFGGNQHLRTWGAVKLLVACACVASVVAAFGVNVGEATLGLGAGTPLALLVLGGLVWDTWNRVARPLRTIEDGYARALDVKARLDEAARRDSDGEQGPLSQEDDARAGRLVRRVEAVHAAATGQNFQEVAKAGRPPWRRPPAKDVTFKEWLVAVVSNGSAGAGRPPWKVKSNTLELDWLRAAARAGRWSVFGDGISEMTDAIAELKRIEMRAMDALPSAQAGDRPAAPA